MLAGCSGDLLLDEGFISLDAGAAVDGSGPAPEGQNRVESTTPQR
jgi:hypothetical protein